jgi:hypothetical protein
MVFDFEQPSRVYAGFVLWRQDQKTLKLCLYFAHKFIVAHKLIQIQIYSVYAVTGYRRRAGLRELS